MTHACPWCEELDSRVCVVVERLVGTVAIVAQAYTELRAEIDQLKAAFDELHSFTYGTFENERN